jgi:hypothetical protein
VELFFCWIKQHLRIKAFYGTSENAVSSQTLRQDAALGLTIFRRHLAIGLFTAATLLAAAIFTFAVAHLITD